MSNKPIDTWITNLNHEDKQTRKEAILALSYTGQPAIEPLVHALMAGQVTEETLADIMSRIGNDALDQLTYYLEAGDLDMRRRIAHVLGMMAHARTIMALIMALQDSEDSVRAEVAASLGNFNDPRGAKPLMDRLQDEAILVRANAAEALRSYHRDPEVLPSLIRAASDNAREVRIGVARALGYFRDERSVAMLNQLTEDEDSEVRHTAAASLQHHAGDRMVFDRTKGDITHAVNVSIDQMLADDVLDEDDMDKMRDSNPRVRARLLEYISQQGGSKAFNLLVPGLKDINPAVRQTAVDALARLGRANVSAVIDLLESDSAYVRAGAVEALGIIESDDLVERIAPLVNDEADVVRREVVQTLTRFSERAGAKEALQAAQQDADKTIRDLAAGSSEATEQNTSNPLKRFFKRFSN